MSSNSDILWDRIVSIEPLGPMQVYDIEVEATHNFIAQGIVAHNTYSQRTEEAASPITLKKLKDVLEKYNIQIDLPKTLKELTPELLVEMWLKIKGYPKSGDIKVELQIGSLASLVNSLKEPGALKEAGHILAQKTMIFLEPIIKQIEEEINKKNYRSLKNIIDKAVEDPLLDIETFGDFPIFANFDQGGNSFAKEIRNDFTLLSTVTQLSVFSPDALGSLEYSLTALKATFCKLCLRVPAERLPQGWLIWDTIVTPEVFRQIVDWISQDNDLTEDMKSYLAIDFLIRIIEDSAKLKKDDHLTKPQNMLFRNIVWKTGGTEAWESHLKEYRSRYKDSLLPLANLAATIVFEMEKAKIKTKELVPVFQACFIPMDLEAIENFFENNDKKQLSPI